MLNLVVVLHCLEMAVPPLAFLLISWLLLVPKISRRTALGAVLVFLAAEAALQAVILFLGKTPEFAAGLLPVTFYLPAILGLHLLSERRFTPTALIWLLALICAGLLNALHKLLVCFFTGPGGDTISAVVFLLAAGLLALLVDRFLRKPFLTCTKELEPAWPQFLLLPGTLLALYSYYLSSAVDTTTLILLFLTAVISVYVLIRLMISLEAERQARAEQRQMEALRMDYDILQKKLALGRGYRHDMRHHMAALTAMLQQKDYDEALRYVSLWQGQLVQIETETWCRNPAVNAVLSAYLTQARETGCKLQVEVKLPAEFSFEETDLCVVLANALENAVHACEALPDGMSRHIKLSAVLTDQRRLTVSVENTCGKTLAFDENGFPIVPRREGHGQGLKSIATVAEKYHGLFQCACEGGVFTLHVVLLDNSDKPRRFHRARGAAAAVFMCCLLLNCMPAVVDALETVPGLGGLVRVVDLRTYFWKWGSTGSSREDPVLEGDAGTVEAVEAQKEEFIRQMRERFIGYVIQKYQGYTAEDIAFDLVRDDAELFVLRFHATINAGSSGNYSRYITMDRRTGEILELASLFQPESNYIFPISREIKAQMEEQVNTGDASYFLPGGIWSDEECFASIDPAQNFYINDTNQLVITFGEYEVAPGSMGEPEFVIPTGLLDGLLAEPSILK